MNINAFGESIKGRRSNNQDSYIILPINQETWFFAVADGMGGTIGGEIASKIAIDTSRDFLLSYFESYDSIDLKFAAKEIVRLAQEKVKLRIEKNPELNGMGTTLTYLLVHKNKYLIGNIGDSRVYFIHDDSIEQITKDHSYIQQLMDEHGSNISQNFLENNANIILKAVDGGNENEDVFPLDKDFYELKKNSAFLLCSDGLILEKQSKSIETKIISMFNYSPEKMVKNLISNAYKEGSTDNITAIYVDVERVKVKKVNRKPTYLLLVSFIIIAFLIGVVLLLKKKEITLIKKERIIQEQIDSIITNSISLDTTGEKNVQLWYALKKQELPLDTNSYIEWEPYQDSELNYYRLILFNMKNDSINSLEVSDSLNSVRLTEIKEIRYGKRYKLMIEAVLNDTTVSGNIISFKTKK